MKVKTVKHYSAKTEEPLPINNKPCKNNTLPEQLSSVKSKRGESTATTDHLREGIIIIIIIYWDFLFRLYMA